MSQFKGQIISKIEKENLQKAVSIDLSCAVVTQLGEKFFAYYPSFENRCAKGKNFVQMVYPDIDNDSYQETEVFPNRM